MTIQQKNPPFNSAVLLQGVLPKKITLICHRDIFIPTFTTALLRLAKVQNQSVSIRKLIKIKKILYTHWDAIQP